MGTDRTGLTRRATMTLAVAAGAASLVRAAAAADWPSRPVTMVVPYAPGASNDTFTRALANLLSKRFGQPFVVENRPGAGGFTGSNAVAQAAPDGYMFLEMPNSVSGFKPVMKVNLDPLKDLTPIGLMARSPTAMLIPSGLPPTNVREFIDYAKAAPDKVFYGMAGIGTTQQQHAELFNKNTGLRLKGVNYKSSADAQTDLIAGRLHVMFATVASTLGQIKAGQLKLLAYTSPNIPEGAPRAPTMAEAGVPGMESAQIFWALFGPKNLPADIKTKMNAAMNEALKDPGFQELIRNSGGEPAPVSPEDVVKVLEDEAKMIQYLIDAGVLN